MEQALQGVKIFAQEPLLPSWDDTFFGNTDGPLAVQSSVIVL